MSKTTIRIHVSKIPREILERAYKEIAQARSNTQAEKSNKAVNG